MARYELEPTPFAVMKKGKKTTEERRPSTESTVWSLSHLTLCRIVENMCRKRAVYSNWNPLSREIFANIRSGGVPKHASAAG